MHIPDGMLEARTWIPAWLGSAGTLAYALREVRKRLSDGTIVMMAVLAALIFALQMLNFPVAGGTSGHFAGGAAAAIVLGLWPAMLVMAAVVTVQALFFADGGITTLGANMLTMAVIGPLVGYAVHGALTRLSGSRGMKLVASFLAAWTACVTAAIAAGVLLWLSGRAPLGPVVGAMGFWHALIGLGEGAITAGLVGYLLAVRPDLLSAGKEEATDTRSIRKTAIGMGAIALVAVGISFIASAHPDGLEFVYERVGTAIDSTPILGGVMPDYVMPGITNETLAGILAGVVGIIVTGALVYAILSATRSRRARQAG
ncbi:MAG: energy-coupling factor ABC transporter permease [Coriobacteriia bacterium]|nr:energy-coupling factor ABC transporter permease [Coriobacteriia bacterium]